MVFEIRRKKVFRQHPPRYPERAIYGGNPKCLPYKLQEPDWGPIDYYLVALDADARKVYFISGNDIFLQHVIKLYPGFNDVANIKDLNKEYLYYYIRDRLYNLQVVEVSEKNIVAADDDKLVFHVSGEEYKEENKYEVTFYFESPEVLRIKKL